MRSAKKLVGLGLVAGTLAFAGCAPVSGTWGYGPGLQLGISPGGSLNLFNSQCSMLGTPGTGSPFNRTASASAVAMARLQQVSQVQARLSSGIETTQARDARWKRIAGGGC